MPFTVTILTSFLPAASNALRAASAMSSEATNAYARFGWAWIMFSATSCAFTGLNMPGWFATTFAVLGSALVKPPTRRSEAAPGAPAITPTSTLLPLASVATQPASRAPTLGRSTTAAPRMSFTSLVATEVR